MMKKLFSTLAFLAVAVGSASSQAATAVTYTPTATDNTFTGTIGFTFTTASTISVTALGVFDDSRMNLISSHQVGIFSSTGTLIFSATVSPTVGSQLANFYYNNIAPVQLAAGTYSIGALYTIGDGDIYGRLGTAVGTAPVTFGNFAFTGGTGLTAPATGAGQTASSALGANFQFTTVPEPASIVLMGLGGLAAFGFTRRKSAKA